MKNLVCLILMFACLNLSAQLDSTQQLKEISIKALRTINGVGHLQDLKDGIIYAGKKNEIIVIDSLDANKADNNTRQILGRIPGLNIVETESGGFTANGVATRGLNPVQSVEMNTRQNGYGISADVFGYNEAYYLPPMEAVSRVEMVRGAASLQFGSQFGGLINYVLREAPANKVFEFNTSQTIGSYGLFNSFNSVGGSFQKIKYYGYLQYKNMAGFRPNSQQRQLSGFGQMQFKPTEKITLGLEYSLLRNELKMPGGLTDSLFNADPSISTRSRNWLKTPWNIAVFTADFRPSENTTVSLKSSFLSGNRSLVWRDEDGGAAATDLIDTLTNAFINREVGIQKINNSTTELRASHSYNLGNQKSTIAGGVRFAYAWLKRLGGGKGTTASDFDLSIVGDWGYNLDFTTTNIAPFVENIFKIGEKFTITPGIRFEYLKSTVKGYKKKDGEILNTDKSATRTFPLFGLGLEYKPFGQTSIYGNFSQAYRPIEYSQLQPFGVSAQIDPNMKDANGFNTDLGFRGTVKNYFNFDIGGFYMAYNNRIGVTLKTDPTTGEEYAFKTNVANSVHKGIESYLELNILKAINTSSKYGLSVFNSFAYVDAAYTSGEFKGKRVEFSTPYINRIGLIFNSKYFSTTFQASSVGDAFGDASNAMTSDDPAAGYIPAYSVIDWSGTFKYKNYSLKFGCNNLANKSYFTRRADEYPGPGIIPSMGRSWYVGLSGKF